MVAKIPDSPHRRTHNFQNIIDAFLGSSALPFSGIISAARIERIFAKHGCLFGLNGIYNTAVIVWSFLGQVLRDGKEASCQSAVARVVTHCQLTGQIAPTCDTGDYCKARAKLFSPALRELSGEIADGLERSADESWLWNGLHAKLIDGFTFTMPDTKKNQAKFPQPKTQALGVGLPIARAVAILSLATACVIDAAVGPYKGKETGESALLRQLLGAFNKQDVAVFDRYCCSFMMIAMFQMQGTDVCARLHQQRSSDFRRGKRLGKHDHIITWTKPKKPKWMDEATYAQIPETLQLREIRYSIVKKGKRTKVITVVTTLIDDDKYYKEEIAELYGFRWHVELDLRSIKSSLNLGHARCKSPEMVRCEMWITLLAYNLIRTTAAGAALLHNKQPRQISFTTTCQYVLSAWMLVASGKVDQKLLRSLWLTFAKQISQRVVANRPGRLEPRVIKRRRHRYKLMQKPREELRQELRNHCT